MKLDDITEDNWKQLAPELAKTIFPIDSLVEFRYPSWKNFGKVKGYTPTGMIKIIPGELDKVNIEIFGAYLEMDYDPDTFNPKPYDECTRNPKNIIRFTPFHSTVGGKSEVSWYRSGAGILHPLSKEDNGLVHDTYLNY